jgi:hypothetical protein
MSMIEPARSPEHEGLRQTPDATKRALESALFLFPLFPFFPSSALTRPSIVFPRETDQSFDLRTFQSQLRTVSGLILRKAFGRQLPVTRQDQQDSLLFCIQRRATCY